MCVKLFRNEKKLNQAWLKCFQLKRKENSFFRLKMSNLDFDSSLSKLFLKSLLSHFFRYLIMENNIIEIIMI
jgi:hypothetical protein